jgi:hypothetical protein
MWLLHLVTPLMVGGPFCIQSFGNEKMKEFMSNILDTVYGAISIHLIHKADSRSRTAPPEQSR